MPYFFSGVNLTEGKIIEIGPPEAGHLLQSRRTKIGEEVKLQGPDGKRFLAQVLATNKKTLELKIVKPLAVPPEPKLPIALFQAVVSEQALDIVFQKGTELGLNKVVLFNTAHVAAKLSLDRFKQKLQRWQNILKESAKQCERAAWPILEFRPTLREVLTLGQTYSKLLLMDMHGQKFASLKPPASLALIVGPEGGFTEEELEQLRKQKNLETMSLGPIVLRAETASLAALALARNIF